MSACGQLVIVSMRCRIAGDSHWRSARPGPLQPKAVQSSAGDRSHEKVHTVSMARPQIEVAIRAGLQAREGEGADGAESQL